MKLFSGAQVAIMKKDMRESFSNKTVKITMVIVPMMMVLIMPCMFTLIAYFSPGGMGDLGSVMGMLPISFSVTDVAKAGYYYIMNYLSPAFFLIVPVMTSSVAAGSSFVGEKERRTLETLLFSPLSVHQLFQAKVMGAMGVALLVTGISFLGFLAVAVVGSALVYGSFVLNVGIWLVIMLLIVPSIALAGVTAIVLASARAKTFQEAQQYGVILIVPVLLVIISQTTGLFLFNAPQLLGLGLTLAVLALALTRLASIRFTPEKLLK